MLALVLKLTLAPALVAAATKVARRVGARAGGLVSGLPVVAAPILVILAIENGDAYARGAASGAVLGVVSLAAFCLAYAWAAERAPVAVALPLGLAAFAGGTAVFSAGSAPLAVEVLITFAAILIVSVLLHRRSSASVTGSRGGTDLLVWRVVLTALLVLALTGAARGLSPHLAGLLTPAPIITSVMAAFTHARNGSPAAVRLLAGLVPALVSFLAFFGVSGALLGQMAGGVVFALATAATLATWALALRLVL